MKYESTYPEPTVGEIKFNYNPKTKFGECDTSVEELQKRIGMTDEQMQQAIEGCKHFVLCAKAKTIGKLGMWRQLDRQGADNVVTAKEEGRQQLTSLDEPTLRRILALKEVDVPVGASKDVLVAAVEKALDPNKSVLAQLLALGSDLLLNAEPAKAKAKGKYGKGKITEGTEEVEPTTE
jgi:hypothetical protein